MIYIPDDYIWIVVVGFIISFVLAFGIGANDVANSFGTSVGSKVLTLKQACIIATFCETLGAVLIGSKVSDTVRKGVFNFDNMNITRNSTDDIDQMLYCQLSSLLGACIWLLIATLLKLPVSASHSIVGAIVGAIMVVYGPKGVNWIKIGMIVASWFLSPLLSGFVSILHFIVFDKFILNKSDPLEPGLMFLPFIYGLAICINVFSILISAPALLYFDRIPLWGMFIITIGCTIITIVAVKFLAVPFIRKKIIRECSQNNSKTSPINEAFIEKSALTLQESNPSLVDSKQVELVQSDDKKTVNDDTVEIIDKPEQDKLFSSIQILAAMFSSFAHGGNDISNAIGPLIAIWVITTTMDIQTKSPTPIWILLYGSVGIAIGLWVWGKKVIQTVGINLTKITPSSGVSIELGAAMTVVVASNIGLPVSTTHCKVGSIVSVGRYRSRTNVNWKIFLHVAMAWLVTVPATGGLSALFTYILISVVPK